MLIMRIMVIVYDYAHFADYTYYGTYCDFMYYGNYAYYADYFVNSGSYRFGSCGSRVAEVRRTSVPPSPRRLMDWALSFVQPCAMVGLNTSRTRWRLSRRRRQSAHPLDRGRWSWTINDDLLLLLRQPENDDLLLLRRLRKSWRRSAGGFPK